MPVYSYTSKDGETIELFLHGHSPKSRVRRNGKVYRRDMIADMKAKPRTADPNAGNLSIAMGCLPTQYAEIAKVMAANGVDYQTTPDGRAMIHSSSHRKAMMKVWGMKDMG